MAKQYYVYVLTDRHRGTLYVGATNDLRRRVYEHKNKSVDGFSKKYHVTSLVYFEETTDVRAVIDREKQIKGWMRAKKVVLIESVNPRWVDLSQGWYDPTPPPDSFAKLSSSEHEPDRRSE
ncbi:MAG: GIY-YIG nuclease family protein [Chloroflexi bacterium]|nr:GIY-YIG nuclease family protein [Chloroflexota bacterium]